MSLTPQFLDELRARTSLSTLISRTVKLQRAGREWKACCPFHKEKTPSFYVNDDKGFWHCFGCSAHGDAIRWLTDARGLPFIDAVKDLADAAGMEMPAPDPRAQEKAEQTAGLYEVMEAAQRWFEDQLGGLAGAEARTYLDKRGIEEATRRRFGFGYAPDTRGQLRTALSRFGDKKLIEAGLLIEPEDERQPYDRFRGRLTFPIRDRRGRVIAFSARIVGAGEPKYLNSPDTPLFDKGRTLFNIDRAAAASRAAKRLLVVEGQMDVIALDQAGFEETVASLGTALTEYQLEILWRLIDVPMLCFDGDAAGQRAAAKAALRALPLVKPDKTLAFALLPPGEDPDDVVRGGGAPAFNAVLERPKALARIIYENELSQRDVITPEGRAGLRDKLDDLARSCSTNSLQEQYRKTFRDQFYEDFGWKKSERRVIGSSVIKTGPRVNPKLSTLFVRSALYGLSRYPLVISLNLDDVGRIHMDHSDLLRWRETLVEAVYARPSIDGDAIQQILETSHLSPRHQLDIQYDLRFPFTRRGVDPAVAMARLTGMVRMMVEELDLDQEMQRLTAAVMNDNSMATYEEIELQRQRLREMNLDLHNRRYDSTQEEEGSGFDP
jgi:DNA primase